MCFTDADGPAWWHLHALLADNAAGLFLPCTALARLLLASRICARGFFRDTAGCSCWSIWLHCLSCRGLARARMDERHHCGCCFEPCPLRESSTPVLTSRAPFLLRATLVPYADAIFLFRSWLCSFPASTAVPLASRCDFAEQRPPALGHSGEPLHK